MEGKEDGEEATLVEMGKSPPLPPPEEKEVVEEEEEEEEEEEDTSAQLQAIQELRTHDVLLEVNEELKAQLELSQSRLKKCQSYVQKIRMENNARTTADGDSENIIAELQQQLETKENEIIEKTKELSIMKEELSSMNGKYRRYV